MRAQCSETDLCIRGRTVVLLLVFEIWSISYSNFVVKWGLRRIQEKKIMLGRLCPLKPPVSSGALPPTPPTGASIPRPCMLLN